MRKCKCSECGVEMELLSNNTKRCKKCRDIYKKQYGQGYRDIIYTPKEEVTDQNAHLKVFMGFEYPDELV